ncbi:MAG: isoprenylcysteine carboxylmethyltransferase family protein [Anaerolineales bacterium]
MIVKIIAFAVTSIFFVYVSRGSIRAPGSHGFYRFFAWEIILLLFLWNVDSWFRNPLAWYQLISWFLLVVCCIPLILGVRSLVAQGKPAEKRETERQLLGFEKTTVLVTTGIYRYIRHPLYSSLVFLAWGIFFKLPSVPGGALVLLATAFLIATAKADETECIRFFGPPYETYRKQTKMFIPFLF